MTPVSSRVTRANGEISRRRILDAALSIAGERGYAGTSISEVSKVSGLPHSSIYWHFKDKDALFAAVIADSYAKWSEDFAYRASEPAPSSGDALSRLHESLTNFPAFLRFGHLVILEQHNRELGARLAFIRIRQQALRDLATIIGRSSGLSGESAEQLAALALAIIDGAFLAGAAGEHALDNGDLLVRMFDACVREAIDGHQNTRTAEAARDSLRSL